MYDAVDDLLYIMKRDYQLKPEYIADAEFTDSITMPVSIKVPWQVKKVPIEIGDPLYFDDCSWTVSYDPKVKAWISFHDWHPELALPSINHFFTTKTVDTELPQCPPGFNYNPVSGLCEQSTNVTEPAEIIVDEVAATVTGGATNCLLDIVIAMDYSGSTGNPNYIPMQFDAAGNLVDDLVARQLPEVRKKLQKNLALKFPVEIDENKAHAVHQWYKNKRNKIK